MTRCPAVIAALPRELKALVKDWRRLDSAREVWVWSNGRAIAACAGMGAERAAIAADAALAAMPVTDLISAGLAGACDPELRAGNVIHAGVVVDQSTGEHYVNPKFQSVLVTVASVMNGEEKSRLRSTLHADAVDMEAATIARIARERALGFQAIKGISDEADFAMEGLDEFATASGQFREGAFALHAALRPALWRSVIALGRNSNRALAQLTRELRTTLDWYEKQD